MLPFRLCEVRIDEVDENNVTALRFAAQYNHPEIVSYLLSLNSSTKIKAKDGIDPLLSAVEKRHVNIVKILLESGASPNKGLLPYYIISYNKQGSFQMITEDYNKGPRVVRKDYVLWKIQNMQ